MSEAMQKHNSRPFTKREIVTIIAIALIMIGYVTTALMSETLIGILLLPIIFIPIIAFFFIKCLKCQPQGSKIIIRDILTKPKNTPLGYFMKYIGYMIYIFLFAILGGVSMLWMSEHFFS